MQLWLSVLITSCSLGAWLIGLYEPSALLGIALLYFSAFRASKATSKTEQVFTHSLFVFLSIGLASHHLPGFYNIELMQSARTSLNAVPMALFLNLDKVHVGLAVVLFLYRPRRQQALIFHKLIVIVAVLLILQLLSIPLGLMKFDFTIPDWLPLWVALNLITCFVEEAFFRGYLQISLQKQFGVGYGLIAASLLFGLAHFSGGPLFMLFAALAGAGYGLALILTGKLRYAVIVHLAFNLSHLIFYTYPLPA